jgi:DNA modification methylase
MNRFKLRCGDNIELIKKLPDNSIDAIVSDPPYALNFMNKKWDSDVPSVEFWKEVYRVLKPGGHVLSFGGTRTYHRMVVNIEDAGFEIRDQIMWLYGSGFPKSHNIGKAVDATIKTGKSNPKSINKSEMSKTDGQVVEVSQPNNGILGDKKLVTKTIGASLETEQAQEWEGWGTALKPANEPICLARKPLSEKSVALNVLKWGTGGINIDGCRIKFNGDKPKECELVDFRGNGYNAPGKERKTIEDKNYIPNDEGRFPANIILDEIAGELLDEQSGVSKSSKANMKSAQSGNSDGRYNWNNGEKNDFESVRGHNDSVGASRFFYQAKVSKKERNMGLDGFEDKSPDYLPRYSKNENGDLTRADGSIVKPVINKNTHPTIKPVQLMSYLCRLITPPGGTILDPFMGSGSTGIAAILEGFNFIGFDLDPDYVKIAEARISNYEKYREFLKPDVKLTNGNKRMASRSENSNSIGLGICKKKK